MTAVCPRCRRPLEASERGGAEARAYPGCLGLLIRHGDLGRVVQAASEPLARAESDGPGADDVLECPDCGRPMEKHGYMGIRAIPIDDCGPCGLVWVDAGELGKMSAAARSTNERRYAREDAERRDAMAAVVAADEPSIGAAIVSTRAVAGAASTVGDSWRLLRWSAGVLRRDGEIAVFALTSFVCMAIVVAVAWSIVGLPPKNDAPLDAQVSYYARAAAFVLAGYGVSTFFTCAIVATTLARLQGGDPTLGHALVVAARRLPIVVGWAAYSTAASLIGDVLERCGGRLGRLASDAGELAWSVATFLVVPIIVVEGKSPQDALERSVALLKRTWGEQVVVRFGFKALFVVLLLPATALVLAGFSVRAADPGSSLSVTLWILAGAYALAVLVLRASLQAIFRGTLYYFAITRRAPAGLDEGLLGVGGIYSMGPSTAAE